MSDFDINLFENWVHSILIEKESLVVLALYANQSLLFFWQQVTVKENKCHLLSPISGSLSKYLVTLSTSQCKGKASFKKIDLCRFHCRYKKFFEPHLKEPCWIVISTCRCSPGVKPVKSYVKQCRLIHHATTKSTLELDFGPHVDQLIVREGPFSLIWNKILYTTF